MHSDFVKSTLGILGTTTAALLADLESSAAIFAGFSTGIFMLASTYIKIRNRKKP